MKAIQVTSFGGPEVLEYKEIDDPSVEGDAVLLEVEAAGVNYADTHQVENTYLAPAVLPLVPGIEVIGRTDGRRVVALLPAGGGYAERAVTYPQLMWDIPEGVDDGAALSTVLQGATAWHLLRTCAHVAEGDSVVVHAAAGGVGTIAIQLAKRWGAGHVIAAASSDEKRELALELGADAVIDSRADNLKAAITDANAGRKVDIVLEMVGGPTFDQSLEALAPFGRLVTYGMASRVPPSPLEPGMLIGRSRAVIGFWLAHCFVRPQLMQAAVTDLLAQLANGDLRAITGGTYPLAEARRAHEDIRGRGTVGKLVLVP